MGAAQEEVDPIDIYPPASLLKSMKSTHTTSFSWAMLLPVKVQHSVTPSGISHSPPPSTVLSRPFFQLFAHFSSSSDSLHVGAPSRFSLFFFFLSICSLLMLTSTPLFFLCADHVYFYLLIKTFPFSRALASYFNDQCTNHHLCPGASIQTAHLESDILLYLQMSFSSWSLH